MVALRREAWQRSQGEGEDCGVIRERVTKDPKDKIMADKITCFHKGHHLSQMVLSVPGVIESGYGWHEFCRAG